MDVDNIKGWEEKHLKSVDEVEEREDSESGEEGKVRVEREGRTEEYKRGRGERAEGRGRE